MRRVGFEEIAHFAHNAHARRLELDRLAEHGGLQGHGGLDLFGFRPGLDRGQHLLAQIAVAVVAQVLGIVGLEKVLPAHLLGFEPEAVELAGEGLDVAVPLDHVSLQT